MLLMYTKSNIFHTLYIKINKFDQSKASYCTALKMNVNRNLFVTAFAKNMRFLNDLTCWNQFSWT